MKDGFRARMGMLHTWTGLVLSALLFAIFWTGTLSVFDKEIDRWMLPDTRITLGAQAPLSVDRDVMPLLKERASGASTWTIVLPRERIPYLSLATVSVSERGRRHSRENYHPVTLERLDFSNRANASNFIYPFHHNLTLRQNNAGAWAVGIASMGMLCLLISGIVIHRKIFADFFTLRLFRSFGRANLDVHNLTGVALLPFTLVITLSGLIVAHLIYFPLATQPVTEPTQERAAQSRAAGPQDSAERRFMVEGLGRATMPAAGQPADIASIDRMIATVERDWGVDSVYLVRITHPGDAKGLVVLRQHSKDSVTRLIGNRRFSLATGEELKSFEASPVVSVWNFIGGLHCIQFSHWLLRWLYFLSGLGSCAMIATGLLHWTQARNKSHRGARLNVALMNTMNIATIPGVIAATGAFLLVNRVVDSHGPFAAVAGRDAEVYAFFGVWLLSALHALLRVLQQRQQGHLQAWREQCWAIGILAMAAVGMNWATTGDHLIKTVFVEPYWPVAAVDMSLLVTAGITVWAARKLVLRERHAQAGKADQAA